MKALFRICNVAVIKGIMVQMTQEEFIVYAQYIKTQAMELPIGTRRNMFVRLYGWCRNHYKKEFKKKTPLF